MTSVDCAYCSAPFPLAELADHQPTCGRTTGPKSVVCPHCQAPAGYPCRTASGAWSPIHAVRVAKASGEPTAASPAPSEPVTTMTWQNQRPKTTKWRGRSRYSTALIYRVRESKRTRDGRMFVLVTVDDVVGGREVGLELTADELDQWGEPDEVNLRKRLEALVKWRSDDRRVDASDNR